MESRPKKSKTKRSLTRSFVVTVAVGVPSALIANVGCSSTQPASAAGGGGPAQPAPGVASGRCDSEGAQQPCHVNLGKTGGGQFQTCYSGTQTCTGGLWSTCGGDGTVTNTRAVPGLSLAPASAGAAQTGIHTLGAGGCGNGICGGISQCVGGPFDGNTCLTSANCAGSPCVALKTCAGGPDLGNTCVDNTDCDPAGSTWCTGASETCATCPQDCGACAPGAADAGVPICASDPCNPNCLGWAQSPLNPISSAGGVGATIIGVSGFGQISNGQISKLLLDNAHTGKKCDDFTTPGLPSSYYNCQIDTYCQMTKLGGDGNCHQFPVAGGVQGTDTKGLGVGMNTLAADVTIGPGCSNTESDKYRYFPICNRGSTAIPVGTKIRVKYFSPVTAFNPCPNNTCTSAAGYDCSMLVGDGTMKNGSSSLGVPLAPGTCQLLDTQQLGMAPGGAACSQPNGDKWIFANCDGALPSGVPEGNLTMNPGVTPPAYTEPTTAPGILGCANNWTDHSPNNNPPACGVLGQSVVSFASDYHAVCPTGTGPVWSKLVYDTSCQMSGSSTSEVYFEAATAPDVSGAPGVYSSFYEMAEATNNAAPARKDPAQCSFTQPSAQSPTYAWPSCTGPTGAPAPPNCCPKDIEAELKRSSVAAPPLFPGADPAPGALLARNDWLRLKITIKSTPDATKNASLNSWSVSYQCVARE